MFCLKRENKLCQQDKILLCSRNWNGNSLKSLFFFFWQFRFSGNASCNICLVICNSEITMLWSKGYDWNSMSIFQMFEWNVMAYYICQNVQHLTEHIAWNAISLITDSSVKLITEFNLKMYVQKKISCRFLHLFLPSLHVDESGLFLIEVGRA